MQRRPFGKRKRSASGAVALTAILALIAVSLVIAGGRVFVVHSVVVEGNRFISAEEIMRTGGIPPLQRPLCFRGQNGIWF